MRDDLQFASAALDWTEANLQPFDARINGWIKTSFQIRISQLEENPTHNLVIAFEKEPLPLAFNVEAGAYINTIRSSLDILATALAERHRMAESENVYFPIAKSEIAFLSEDYKGVKFVKALPSRASDNEISQTVRWRE